MNQNILVTDLKNIINIDIGDYLNIVLVGYSKDNIDELLKYKKKYKNIKIILPSSNFDKAYYKINNHIASFVNNNIQLLSLFKLCKEDLFNIGMIMLALEQDKTHINILTQYNQFLGELNICNNKQFIKSKLKQINYIKQISLLIVINFKVIYLLFKSFIIKAIDIDKLMIDYSGKRVLGSLKDTNSILIGIEDSGKIINYQGYKLFIKQQFNLLKISLKYKLLHQNIAKQSYNLMRILSLINYYNPKVIIGALDASVTADIYAQILKKYNIKFGCYPHGYNYDFRTEYIYIPFDFYFVWSKAHLKQIQQGNLIKNDCKFYITGSPFYNNIDFTNIKIKEQKIKYDILVIGEYYYHNYSVQPFNSIPTLQLANIIKNYTTYYKICIRPRMKDQYYYDMYSVLKDSVTYSFPENETTVTTTILEDIESSKLIISVLSGGIHDTLLLNKPVLQVNLLGIREPKEFDINKIVYYADTPKKTEDILNNFFNDELELLEYTKNNEYYINSGIFNKNKVKQVIDEYL